MGNKNSTSVSLVALAGPSDQQLALNYSDGYLYDKDSVGYVGANVGHLTSTSIVASKRSSGTVNQYVNTASYSPGSLSGTFSWQHVGYRSGTAPIYCAGHLMEVVLFNSALSDSERETLRDNMNAYWAVY